MRENSTRASKQVDEEWVSLLGTTRFSTGNDAHCTHCSPLPPQKRRPIPFAMYVPRVDVLFLKIVEQRACLSSAGVRMTKRFDLHTAACMIARARAVAWTTIQ